MMKIRRKQKAKSLIRTIILDKSAVQSIFWIRKSVKNIRHIRNPNSFFSENPMIRKPIHPPPLCTDIETHPGPVFYIDPSKTISAPYSQGDQIIFGETAGQQCLSVCLCALIYNKRQKICTPQDLVHIMNVGNELYSNLSHLARQSFLLLTELPSQILLLSTVRAIVVM